MLKTTEYKAYTAGNFRLIPQIQKLPEFLIREMELVAQVLPFKSNSYVVNELVDWQNFQNDPIFRLTFPNREMLSDEHFNILRRAIASGVEKSKLKGLVNRIRLELNPHPAGQMELNIPEINGKKLHGIQHKYRETVLFFPSQGQSCHAYCTFCFRWPQFTGMEGMKIASAEAETLTAYLRSHKEVTNLLLTGGDPMVMSASLLDRIISPLLNSDFEHIQTIRIGSKSLSYWPYRFISDRDAADMLHLFEKVSKSGKQLSFMAHFNNPAELKTKAVKQAIKLIRSAGAEIRTQSPILKNINDSANDWASMWRQQVRLGCIPYYMFMGRDTGAKKYFDVSIESAYKIFREAYSKVSGMSRTVRGPVMSASPGKVHILGINEIGGEKFFILQFIQGRDPAWVRKPFFAKYDPAASWLSDLVPAFGKEKFFWQDEFNKLTGIPA